MSWSSGTGTWSDAIMSMTSLIQWPHSHLDNKIKCFIPKTECLVIKAFNSDLLVAIDEQVYELKELSRNERFSKNLDEIVEVKEKKKYIPPMTHPWKIEYFKKQLKKAHTEHVYA